MMISGQDGILQRAGNAKTTIGQASAEEAVKRAILALQIDGKGSNNGITPAKIAEQVNKDNSRSDVTAEGEDFPTNIIFENGIKVSVDLDLTVGAVKEVDPNATYSVGISESQIAPDELFTYEPLNTEANNTQVASLGGLDSMPEKTIKITGINPTYLWSPEKTQYGINYETENFTLTDTLVIPAQVNYNGEQYKVTDVDLSTTKNSADTGNAQSLPDVEKIIYPNTVERIYYTKNSYSKNLSEKKVVKYIILSNKLEGIPKYFFAGLKELTSITIPNSVTSIGAMAFYGCSGLTSITIPNSLTSIGGEVFRGCGLESITIQDGATKIFGGAFYGCINLKNVKIPKSVTSIGDMAFYGCSGLTSITIPNSVTSIGDLAFSWCSGLTSVTIPESVTSIGDSAFSWCKGLTSVTIPESVTSIGNSAFRGCKGLTSITIPNSVTSIGNSFFSGCNGLTNITIPNSVTSIGDSAFSDCKGLTSITIPNSVTSIGNSAFSGCEGLVNLEIPNGVENIGEYAFKGCKGLKTIIIPQSVTQIGTQAFQVCSSLEKVIINKPRYSLTNYDSWSLTSSNIIEWNG